MQAATEIAMESRVEIDASFSNVSTSMVDVFVVCANCRKRISQNDFDWFEENDSRTLKRTRATDPRFELSHADLVRLLSYLEGELQARDVAIAAMKSEKAKQLLYQAKYGHLNLNDPLAALQRDSQLCAESDGFDESSIGRLYENQLSYLERLVSVRRRTHLHAKQVLSFVENRHCSIVRQLEQERRWRAEDVLQGDKICVLLESERERLKEELECQKQQLQDAQNELKQVNRTLSKEREQHKTIILHLQEENKQLRTEVEGKCAKEITRFGQVQVSQMNGGEDSGKSKKLGPFASILANPVVCDKKPATDHQRRVAQSRGIEVPTLRRPSPKFGIKQPLLKTGRTTTEPGRNSSENGVLTSALEGDHLPLVATTSVGVDLQLPQQLLHATGVLRRSFNTVSSPTPKRSVLAVARSYISNATRNGIARRQSLSVSPPLKRLDQGDSCNGKVGPVDIVHSDVSRRSPTSAAFGPLSNSTSLIESKSKSIVQKPNAQSSTAKKHKESLEPEIAELEAVLKSLALAASFSAPSSSVHFPIVEDFSSSKKRSQDKNGVVEKDQLRPKAGPPVDPAAMQNSCKQLVSTKLPVRSGEKENGVKNGDTGTAKRNRLPRIPVSNNRKLSESANGLPSSKRSQIPSSGSSGNVVDAKSDATEKNSPPSGSLSPQMALQRKVKAISGLANRIQRRVVSGVVNQVGLRQRAGTSSSKVQ